MSFSKDNRLFGYLVKDTVEKFYRFLKADSVRYAGSDAASTTVYINVSDVGAVTFGASRVDIPASYAIKITGVYSSYSDTPTAHQVYLTNGTDITHLVDPGTDQYIQLPNLCVWLNHGSSENLTLKATHGTGKTMDAFVVYELYEVELRDHRRFVNV